MTEKMKLDELHQLLEEIQNSEGLPEKIATEAQLFDEILKKEAYVMSRQLFPLIKEIYGKDYPKGTSVEPLATEFSVERTDMKELHSIRADINLLINKLDVYHLECEIQYDGSMVLRMLEYDVHLALSYHATENKEVKLDFPKSAVLYLQDNGSTPDVLHCKIKFQDGTIYDYQVPVLKIQSYSLEEIKQKHLTVLIPFLPLRFRKKAGSAELKNELKKEELTSFYRQLILILEEETEAEYLTEDDRNTILSLLNKSMIRVFYKNEALLKEVIEMTEPILETEFEKTKRYARIIDEKEKELAQKDSQIAELKAQLENLRQNQ